MKNVLHCAVDAGKKIFLETFVNDLFVQDKSSRTAIILWYNMPTADVKAMGRKFVGEQSSPP